MWASKSARVFRAILSFAKKRGGIGFPDPVKYHKASHLEEYLTGVCNKIRNHLSTWSRPTVDLPLEALPLLSDINIPSAVKLRPTVGITLWTLKSTFKTTTLLSPLTPILDTQAFQLGQRNPRLDAIIQQGSFKLLHFLIDNCLMTSREIELKFSSDLNFLCHTWLCVYLHSLPAACAVVQTPSMFEPTWLTDEPLWHSLSHLYASLRASPLFPTIMGNRSQGQFFSISEGQDLTFCS